MSRVNKSSENPHKKCCVGCRKTGSCCHIQCRMYSALYTDDAETDGYNKHDYAKIWQVKDIHHGYHRDGKRMAARKTVPLSLLRDNWRDTCLLVRPREVQPVADHSLQDKSGRRYQKCFQDVGSKAEPHYDVYQ